MFKELMKSVGDMVARHKESQKERLAAFGDDFVYDIDWTPNKQGGVNFKIRSLKVAPNGNLMLVASPQMLAFITAFLLIGLAVMHIALSPATPISYYLLHPINSMKNWYFVLTLIAGPQKLVACAFAGIFFSIGLLGYYKIFRPNVFNIESKKYTFGYPRVKQKIIPFFDLKAIQIISEYCRGDNGGGYLSCELNLVLKDKTRFTVTDHKNAVEVRKAAKAISQALSIPVWDFTNPTL